MYNAGQTWGCFRCLTMLLLRFDYRCQMWQRNMALGKRNPKARMVGRQLKGQCLDSLGRWEDLRVVKQFASTLLSLRTCWESIASAVPMRGKVYAPTLWTRCLNQAWNILLVWLILAEWMNKGSKCWSATGELCSSSQKGWFTSTFSHPLCEGGYFMDIAYFTLYFFWAPKAQEPPKVSCLNQLDIL